MRQVRVDGGFDGFRAAARELIREQVSPSSVVFAAQERLGNLDFFPPVESETKLNKGSALPRVSPLFFNLARDVAHHASEQKWQLLYRLLWRLTFENRALLEISIDDDVHEALMMQKAVKREIHKIHAFVRFQKVEDPDERFIAWMKTDHPCLELAAPFFERRFGDKSWSILTPIACAHWDGEKLTYSDGVANPPERTDQLEDLWRSYYKSIFNPARVKIKAMKKEMPVRYWGALPETKVIEDLIRESPERLRKMRARQNSQAEPPRTRDWPELRLAALECRACPLAAHATQTVFGEGPLDARVMIVGEQPGDVEDQVGLPFAGPAGQVLNDALNEVRIDRSFLYVTNAVKHFKWKPDERGGKMRIHQKPSGSEMHACKPWLEREIDIVKPEIIICLGQTAATALFGKLIKIGDESGKVHGSLPWAKSVLVSYHPSAILRAFSPEEASNMKANLVETLRVARDLVLRETLD